MRSKPNIQGIEVYKAVKKRVNGGKRIEQEVQKRKFYGKENLVST